MTDTSLQPATTPSALNTPRAAPYPQGYEFVELAALDVQKELSSVVLLRRVPHERRAEFEAAARASAGAVTFGAPQLRAGYIKSYNQSVPGPGAKPLRFPLMQA